MKRRRRVVVTGAGFRSPIGNTWEDVKAALLSGRSGISIMPEWDQIDHLRTRVAGIVRDADVASLPRIWRRTMGRVSVLAVLAVRDAVTDAALKEEEVSSPNCGISFGSTTGSSEAMESFVLEIFKSGKSLRGLQSSTYLKFMSHTCAANLAMAFKVHGPVIASCTACVAGSQGIGFGFDAIASERADLMITGGAEEMHYMVPAVFDIMHATSCKYNASPHETPRPFDAARDGLVTAEGSACLILEDCERALARGARIYAEVLGYATNCDGSHMTSPEAEGMAGVIRQALRDADLSPSEINHVNAHATATEAGDLAEATAIAAVFGGNTPVTAFKGYTGHMLGACGAFESLLSILMMREGFIAPTKNLTSPDPALPRIDLVFGSPRDADLSIVMNNNFAFGGVNTSLIFKRFQG